MKSKVAAEAVKAMNPKMNIHAFVEAVLPETEHIYDDNFFEQLSGAVNALDNVKARKFDEKFDSNSIQVLFIGILKFKYK